LRLPGRRPARRQSDDQNTQRSVHEIVVPQLRLLVDAGLIERRASGRYAGR
jgi:hypothetical protein